MFVPGHRPRFLQKCATLSVDAVLLDLEDGVLPAAKPDARVGIREALRTGIIPQASFIRTNLYGSPWFEEDVSAWDRSMAGICLPKVEDPSVLIEVAERLENYEREVDVATGTFGVIVAVESARGLLRAPELAAGPRVVGLILGSEDYALDLGLSAMREGESRELLYARSALVVAARASGAMAIDGVYPNLDDAEGLRQDAAQARRLGFSGKSLFHPNQIDQINATFSPSDAEIAYAAEIVEAFAGAEARGDGAVAVGGQLVDLPILRRAERLLEIAADRGEEVHRSAAGG